MSICRTPLEEILHQHLRAVTINLLQAYRVQEAARWCPVIECLAQKAAESISPLLFASTGSIDPRNLLKVSPKGCLVCQGWVMYLLLSSPGKQLI